MFQSLNFYNDADTIRILTNVDDENDVDDFSYRTTKTHLLGMYSL